MKSIFRNSLAVIIGWLLGSVVNMSLIQLGYSVYPIEGLDPNDMEALAEALPNLGYEYFIFPFLAHALGTLVGAFIATKIAATHKKIIAITIGAVFMIGGILVAIMVGGPVWFTVLDLLLAYIPMALIGYKLGIKK
jgi:hypothetical protein